MRKINKQWRGKDFSTDVLSFPLLQKRELPKVLKEAQAILLGDIVISQSMAVRQAIAHGLSFKQELDLLLVHGILHLLGFDHEKSLKENIVMRQWEKRLLGRIGLTR